MKSMKKVANMKNKILISSLVLVGVSVFGYFVLNLRSEQPEVAPSVNNFVDDGKIVNNQIKEKSTNIVNYYSPTLNISFIYNADLYYVIEQQDRRWLEIMEIGSPISKYKIELITRDPIQSVANEIKSISLGENYDSKCQVKVEKASREQVSEMKPKGNLFIAEFYYLYDKAFLDSGSSGEGLCGYYGLSGTKRFFAYDDAYPEKLYFFDLGQSGMVISGDAPENVKFTKFMFGKQF
jgi:hypothetical protein